MTTKLPTKAPASNFLLQVTLLKTTNPVVSRLLSVPVNINFWELHEATEANFGWNDNHITEITSAFPNFKVIEGNPFEAERVNDLEILLDLLSDDGAGKDVNTDKPGSIASMQLVRFDDVLDNCCCREKFINYAYDRDFFHML